VKPLSLSTDPIPLITVSGSLFLGQKPRIFLCTEEVGELVVAAEKRSFSTLIAVVASRERTFSTLIAVVAARERSFSTFNSFFSYVFTYTDTRITYCNVLPLSCLSTATSTTFVNVQ